MPGTAGWRLALLDGGHWGAGLSPPCPLPERLLRCFLKSRGQGSAVLPVFPENLIFSRLLRTADKTLSLPHPRNLFLKQPSLALTPRCAHHIACTSDRCPRLLKEEHVSPHPCAPLFPPGSWRRVLPRNARHAWTLQQGTLTFVPSHTDLGKSSGNLATAKCFSSTKTIEFSGHLI